MPRIVLLYSLMIFFLSSCSSRENKAEEGTFFGGEIVNPVSNTIILRKEGQEIYTATLDREGRFLFKIEPFEEGIYEFYEGERQLIYLTEKDSLLIRVNTKDFDESLSFSGFGAITNEFMLRLFLINEQENAAMTQEGVFGFKPKQFNTYIDSLMNVRIDLWSTYKKQNTVPEGFEEVAQGIIDYDLYAKKEVYPLTSFIKSKAQFLKAIPSSFYDYRKNTDLNNEKFLSLYAYQRFLLNYFNRQAFIAYSGEKPYDPFSFTHNFNKMRAIDKEVASDSIKSYLLTRTIRDYLNNSNDKKGGESLYEIYVKNNQSKKDSISIARLYAKNTLIEAGKTFPEEMLINPTGKEILLSEIIARPTILYFWSYTRPNHMRRAHERINELRSRFPQFTYLGINLNDNQRQWIRVLRQSNYAMDTEFMPTIPVDLFMENLNINNIVKTFIIDKNETIINAHANIFSSHFEDELLQYINAR